MRTGVILAIALIASVAFCQSASFTTFVKPAVNKYCRRTYKTSSSGLLNQVNLVATLGCVSVNGTQATSGRYGVIGFQLSSALIPTFGIYSFNIGGSGMSGDAYLFGARFGIDSLVEYVETNGEEGYQPFKDKLVKEYSLSDFLGINGQWSDPVLNATKLDASTTVYRATTSFKPRNEAHTVKWGALATTDEVISGDSSTKVILTPNSIKTIFEVSNFKYVSTDTNSRLAIGTVLIAAGGSSKWESTPRSKDGERPNEVTDKQAVFGIGASANAKNNGYFSYQKYVSSSDTTQSGATRTVTLTGSSLFETNNSTISKAQGEAAVTFKRIYFTVNERVSQFSWDPSLGNQEEQENQVPTTNSASKLSFLILVLTFAITLLMQ